MGVHVKRDAILTEKNGTKTIVPGDSALAFETFVTVTCDSKSCKRRNEKVTVIEYQEEDLQTGKATVPDSFFLLLKLTIHPIEPQELAFCCPRCLRDYMDNEYFPKPRQSTSVQPPADGLPTSEDLDRAINEGMKSDPPEIFTNPDATGYSEETA